MDEIDRVSFRHVLAERARASEGVRDLAHHGETADEVINAQDRHLKDMVASGDTAHVPARKEMKGRWRHPIAGMGWYRTAKKDFAALPDD